MNKWKKVFILFLLSAALVSSIPFDTSHAKDVDGTNMHGARLEDTIGEDSSDDENETLLEDNRTETLNHEDDLGVNPQEPVTPSVVFDGSNAADKPGTLALIAGIAFEVIDSDGLFLDGAEVRIKDAGGNEIDTWISGEGGYNYYLNPGDYFFEIVSVPDGYMKPEAIPFTVDDGPPLYLYGVKWDSSKEFLANYFKTDIKRTFVSSIEWEEDAEKKAELIRLFNKYNTRWDSVIDTAAADYFEDSPSGEADGEPQKDPTAFLLQIYDAMMQDIDKELNTAEQGTAAYDAAAYVQECLDAFCEAYTYGLQNSKNSSITIVIYKAPVDPGGAAAIDLPVTKTWEDEDDRFKLRPDTVTVNLLADKGNGPEQTGQTLQLSEGGNWEDAFSHLPVYNYDADGKATEKIIYTIEEEPIEHYTEEITYKGDGGAEIKNKLVTYPVVISKQNEENENLVGAVLQIFDAGNNPVTERWVSGQTDKTIQLPSGTYRLHEEASPIRYKKADDLFFTVEGNGIIKVNNANVEKVVLKNYKQSPQGLGIGGDRIFSKAPLLLLALGIIGLLLRDEKRRKEE